jgi:hypothetical protein
MALKGYLTGCRSVVLCLLVRSRLLSWIAVSLVACVLCSYIVPAAIERMLVSRIGPFWAYVMLGDVVGCALIGALTRWSLGIALYFVLDAVEAALYAAHIVSPVAMMWLADMVPTLLLCVLAIMVVRVRGGWRLNLYS